LNQNLLPDRNSSAILEALLNPQSIALFGASNQEGKVGYVCLKNLLEAFLAIITRFSISHYESGRDDSLAKRVIQNQLTINFLFLTFLPLCKI